VLRLITACLLAIPSPVHLSVDDMSSGTRIYFSLALGVELLVSSPHADHTQASDRLQILGLSAYTLRTRRPPQVRLLDTSSARGRLSAEPLSRQGSDSSSRYGSPAPAPAPVEADFLAALSLSGHPVLPHNPVFGTPSMHAPAPAPRRDADEDAMDWAPTHPAPAPVPRAVDDGSWLRPQRFFAPEQPTGLESLLARTGLSEMAQPAAPAHGRKGAAPAPAPAQWRWGWVYAASLIPLLGIGMHAWMSRPPASAPAPPVFLQYDDFD
jgi:hypothetical protein